MSREVCYHGKSTESYCEFCDRPSQTTDQSNCSIHQSGNCTCLNPIPKFNERVDQSKPVMTNQDIARKIRLKIAQGIFVEKWSSDEVDKKEEALIVEALDKSQADSEARYKGEIERLKIAVSNDENNIRLLYEADKKLSHLHNQLGVVRETVVALMDVYGLHSIEPIGSYTLVSTTELEQAVELGKEALVILNKLGEG